jgi:hypothetical protein
MTTEELLRCERECTRLCHDFIYNIDRRNYDALIELFGPDPVLDRTGTVYKGRDGVRAFLAGRPGDMYVRHTSSNIRVDMVGPRAARGTSCATMFRATAEPDAALPLPTSMLVFAEYEDDYVLTEMGWKISQRKIKIIFQP